MKKILLLCCLLISAGKSLSAGENYLNEFNRANELYKNGDYSQSIQIYESIRAKQGRNPILFYNLGNAYFKNQQIGYAILNYERALRLSPRDADIRHNLDFVRQLMKEPQPSFYSAMISSITGFAALNEITVICSVFYFVFSAGIVAYLFSRRRWLIIFNVASLTFLIILSGWLLLKIGHDVRTKWAIVVSVPVDVRNGPGVENSVGFNLPEGRKITILGEKDGWAAIGLESEGLKGWVEKKYIEQI